MIKNYESIEERIRNCMGIFNNHIQFLQMLNKYKDSDLENFNKILNILLKNTDKMNNVVSYLIELGNIVDQNLPKDFSINEVLPKEQIYK